MFNNKRLMILCILSFVTGLLVSVSGCTVTHEAKTNLFGNRYYSAIGGHIDKE